MRSKIIFIAAACGVLFALASAYVFGRQAPALPPTFSPAANPYARGIYANGIIESAQAHGQNVTIYPEISGTVATIAVSEGAKVRKGDVLLTIDDTVQRAQAEQQQAQADAALALLNALKAQPRPENLDVAAAQVENAKAALKNAQDQLAKQEKSFAIDARSVSRDVLDNARNAEKMAEASLGVVQKQYDLIKAGAWSYDVANQQKQYEALTKAAASSQALLDKYTLKAPADGAVLLVQAAVGGYVSPQGAYDSYTQGMGPLVIMGAPDDHLQVRAYIDEILLHNLADPAKIDAQMFIRGTDVHVPLVFERIQPYVSPKIELSNQRQERVDVRVLPVIFRFEKPKDLNLYPGQLVDVYVGEK